MTGLKLDDIRAKGVNTLQSNAYLLCAIVVTFFIVAIVYFPGFMTNDSLTHFSEGKTGNISLYHPPVMALLFDFSFLFTDDQSAFFLMQQLLYVGGLTLFSFMLLEKDQHRALFITFFVFFPPIFGIAGTLWKDVWFTGATIFVYATVLRMKTRPTFSVFLLFLAFWFLAKMVRHEAIVVLVPATALAFFYMLRPLKLHWVKLTLGTTLLMIVLVGGMIKIGNTVHEAVIKRDLKVASISMYYDLMGISLATNEVIMPGFIWEMNPELTIDQIRDGFNPSTASSFLRFMNRDTGPFKIIRPTEEDDFTQLMDTWFGAILDHPVYYVMHRLRFIKILASLDGSPHFPYYYGIAPNDLGLEWVDRAPSRWANALQAKITADVGFLYYPYLYVLAALALMIIQLWRMTELTPFVIALLASGLLHFSIFCIIGAGSDFRLSHWLVHATLLASIVMLVDQTPNSRHQQKATN